MSDYTLVEEANRAAAAALRATASTASTPTQSARTKRANLAREAANRRVHLHLLPVGFSRGRRNSTFVRGRRGFRQIHWHIDVVFVTAKKERRVSVDSCVDSTGVGEIVAGAVGAFGRRRGRVQAVRTGLDAKDVDVFILNEHVVGPASPGPQGSAKAKGEDDMHRYLALEKGDTLECVLRDRIIIEFPIFYCAVRGSTEAKRLASAMAGVFERPEPESEDESDGEVEESEEDSETESLSGGDLDISKSVKTDVEMGGEVIDFDDTVALEPSAKRARISPSSEMTAPMPEMSPGGALNPPRSQNLG